jgi:hypothetical protein
MVGRGQAKNSEKTCSSVALSSTNPTWSGRGSNLGRRGGKQTNIPMS